MSEQPWMEAVQDVLDDTAQDDDTTLVGEDEGEDEGDEDEE